MAGFTREEHIDRTPEQVWDWFVRLENVKKWNPTITNIVQVTEGETGVGTRYRETRRMGKRQATAEVKISEFDAPRTYAAASEQGGIWAQYRFRLEPEGQGTRIHLEAEVKGKFLMKILVPMVRKYMEKEDGDQLARLKHAVETEVR